MIAAIIVAAGRSSRMGTSKALLPHRDPSRTLVGYLVRAALTGGATPVLVVGRPGDAELENEAIAGGGVFVTNDTTVPLEKFVKDLRTGVVSGFLRLEDECVAALSGVGSSG